MAADVRHFLECGLPATGFDGNPATPRLSQGTCGVLDLAVLAEVRTPWDWVLSLEVGAPREWRRVAPSALPPLARSPRLPDWRAWDS